MVVLRGIAKGPGSHANPAKRFVWEKEEQRNGRGLSAASGGQDEGCGVCSDATPPLPFSFYRQRSFLPYLFCQDRKDMARGAADAASQIAPRLRRIRTAPPEASHAIRRKKTPPFWGFFYAQSYPHVDVDCLQIFCSQLRNRCFTKLPVDRSDLRAHLPVDK